MKQFILRVLNVSPDELLNECVRKMGNLNSEIDPVEEKDLFLRLKGVDGFHEWIDSQTNADIKRHFSAINDTQRSNIRGAMMRLIDIKHKMAKADQPTVTRISGIRYGI